MPAVKPWNDLTDIGRARRLRPLVTEALRAFGITEARIRLFEVATNVVFRVDTPDASFAMKVEVEDDFTEQHVGIALDWLAALGTTDIPVVRLVQTTGGENYTYESVAGVPENRRCTLYEWSPGRTIFDNTTASDYRTLGMISAQLHEHALTHQPVAEPLRWDKVVYYPDEEYIIESAEYADRITPDMRAVSVEAIAAVTPILESLYDTPGRLIHADLHGWNVTVNRGKLTVLDFDDVMWGQPVHDIAITYGYKRNDEAYPTWIEAYQEGYESVAPWPVTSDEHIPALMVARRLMFTNYVLTLRGDWSKELAEWEAHFKEYLNS